MTEDWDNPRPKKPSRLPSRRTVLVDLDHTLSNAFHRDPMIGAVSWDEYHTASAKDLPLHDIAHLINNLHDTGYAIVALTARPEKFRQITNAWLIQHRIRVDEILMRSDEKFRPSPEMKKELALARFPDIKNEVAFLIEDRTDVCNVFREIGITVLQVFGRQE